MSKSRAMFVFADESGDADVPGIKPYFAFTAVAFADEERRDALEATFKQFRQDKRLGGEPKFWTLDKRLLTELFTRIGDLHFRFSSCVFRKDGATSEWKKKRFVQERVVRDVVSGLVPYFREIEAQEKKPLKVFLTHDEHTDRAYTQTIKDEFKKPRAKSGSPFVGDIKPGKSRSSQLLQFVDFLCGAARWQENTYRKFISKQCLLRSELP